MEHKITLDPALNIDPKDFVQAWNETSLEMAEAKLRSSKPEDYSLEAGLIFLGGVAVTLAADVLQEVIKEKLVELYQKTLDKLFPEPEIEVIKVPQSDGSILFIAKKREE